MGNSANAAASDRSAWLALSIGNSRLHWALFQGDRLKTAWETPHLDPHSATQLVNAWSAGYLWSNVIDASGAPVEPKLSQPPPLWIASVVPEQLKIWQGYSAAVTIALEDVPLLGVYPSLGIDRALAVVGAGMELGWPILAIDAGTALTFTGADERQQLVGGAILPGFGLQLRSLSETTAALPQIELPVSLPVRWATDTVGAIESGVIYTIVAGVRDFIEDWWQQYPESGVAIAGGGGEMLMKSLQARSPHIAAKAIFAPHAIFWGMRCVKGRSD